MSIVIISISSWGGRHGFISSDKQISREHLLVWHSSSTEGYHLPSMMQLSNVPLYNLFFVVILPYILAANRDTPFIHGRKNTYRQLAPLVLFSQSGNKPSRKATKFKKLKSINRVDIWNCNLCYHRLPAHFYSTPPPTEGVSKDIAGNRGKRSLSPFHPFLLSFFIEFYSI